MLRGRPPKYKPEYADQAIRLNKLGMTESEMAQFFEVNPLTIWRWKNEHEDFCKALCALSKEEADEKVVQSLYKRAVGFSREAVKIFMPAGASEPVYASYVEHYPPDPGAAKLWLTNRRPKEWRDRIVHSGDPDSPIVPILTVTVKSE
jgi:hypothetical protein